MACAVCPAVFAQDNYPEFDIFLGYSLLKIGEFDGINPGPGDLIGRLELEGYDRFPRNKSGFLEKGFIMTYTYHVTPNVGLDASFRYNTGYVYRVSGRDSENSDRRKDMEFKRNDFAFLAGPRYTFRNVSGPVEPFLYGLVGFSRDRLVEEVTDVTGEQSSTSAASLRNHRSFAFAVGGGLDFPINGNLVVRAIQGDFYVTKHPARLYSTPGDAHKRFGNVNFSFGIVYRFGN